MDPAQLLRAVPLFQHLSPDQMGQIAEVVTERKVAGGTTVVEIGDPGQALFLIVDGDVRVLYPSRSGDFELARLGPGDFFGEMALLNDKPRSATVRAASDTRLLVVDRKEFRRILLAAPGVAVTLLEALSLRIRHADEQISALSDKAMRDSLTDLLNRRAFHERLNEEVDRQLRYGDEFALVLVDIDRFSAVNESFGYEVGDRVLTWLGDLLREHTRAADVPFRVGGEEFAVLAPSTGGEIAGIVAERLVRMVEEVRPPLDFELAVTISAGFASCPRHATQPVRIFNIANEALHRAKEGGRNRVCAPA